MNNNQEGINLLKKKHELDEEFKNKAYVKLYSEILEQFLQKDFKQQEENKEIIVDILNKLK